MVSKKNRLRITDCVKDCAPRGLFFREEMLGVRASTRYIMSLCAGSYMKRYNIVELPKIHDPRGNLTFVENNRHIPFDIKRVYYLYDVPGGESRGGHAHRDLHQLLIAISGSFDVVLDDGLTKEVITLNRADRGLLIRPGVWRELTNFSSGSSCLVLASEFYLESDYIRDYEEFIEYAKRFRSVSQS